MSSSSPVFCGCLRSSSESSSEGSSGSEPGEKARNESLLLQNNTMSKTTGAQLLRERTEMGLRDHSGDCCSLRMGVQSQASSRRSAPATGTFPGTSPSFSASRESHFRRALQRAKRLDRRLDAVGGARALCPQTCAVSTLCTDQGTKVPALTVSSSPERYGFLRTGFA